MTRYSDDLDCPVVFEEQTVAGHARRGAVAGTALASSTCAETEKYAHVTYFFNGGVEEEWPGETRILVPSPRDVRELRPEARDVGRRRWPSASAPRSASGYRFAVVNFANPDMVGHTGVIPAVVAAVETTDRCLGRVVDARRASSAASALVTADHGNAEQLLEADGVSPHTAHTTNPVPLVVTAAGASCASGGELADLAPTCLDLLGIAQPRT